MLSSEATGFFRCESSLLDLIIISRTLDFVVPALPETKSEEPLRDFLGPHGLVPKRLTSMAGNVPFRGSLKNILRFAPLFFGTIHCLILPSRQNPGRYLYAQSGGGRIRTSERVLKPFNTLAPCRFQPLSHASALCTNELCAREKQILLLFTHSANLPKSLQL